MASSRWLGFLTNPNQFSTLLLGIAVFFITATMIPPSSTIYLIRADYSSNKDVTSTTWFGSLGYCTANTNNDASTRTRSDIQCTGSFNGYNVERALEQDGPILGSMPHTSASSILITRGLFVLSPIAYTLCLVGMAAYQSILCRPTATKYAISVGSSLLALLVSGVEFLFELSLQSHIASKIRTTDASFTITNGPLVYALLLALLFQVSACTVGFYSCIGGKYQCERGIQLKDEESSRSDANIGRGTNSHCSSIDEKSSFSGL